MERQYRQLSAYNRIRVINEIEKIIISERGEILRTHYDKDIEIKCYTMETDPHKKAVIDRLPIIMSHGEHLHLNFIMHGYYFHFSFDNNPFFPTGYQKIKVDQNGNYIGKRYLYTSDDDYQDTLRIHLCYDCIFKIMDNEAVKKCAFTFWDSLQNYIINGKENEVYIEQKYVPNIYNNGYHKERVFDNTLCCIYYNQNNFNHNYIERR